MPTTPTPRSSSVRRTAALVALATLSVLGTLGLTARPAAAYAPVSPRPVLVAGYADFVRVYWAPPADIGGKPITNYKIERWSTAPDAVSPQKTWNRTTTAPLVDTTIVFGQSYKYRYQATNADGTSAWSTFSNITPPDRGELYRFGYDASDFVRRQYQDLLGRLPNAFEEATYVNGIENETMSAGKVIGDLLATGSRVQLRHPVIRLYEAYFDRAPDHGGLDYWVGKRKGGTNLDVVSAKFAGSPEFKSEYGTLSNTAFIDLVYQNVLGRSADPAGAAYWKKQLDGGTSRGRMMTQFSESNEFKGSTKGLVEAADVYDDMMDEAIAGSERTLWAAHIHGGGNAGDYGTILTLRNGY